MNDWRIHWLEADGSLEPWREPVGAAIGSARARVSALVPESRFDILVQLGKRVVPEIGMLGIAHRKSLLSLTLDPDNPKLSTHLADDTCARQVVHEVHHCLRMAGPGYGRSLGEALVGEGLAGQFVRALYGNDPEPWEDAVDQETMRRFFPDNRQLISSDHLHAEWFFGANGTYPRWLGYSLGYAIAGAWVRAVGPQEQLDRFNVPAEVVLSIGKSVFMSHHS